MDWVVVVAFFHHPIQLPMGGGCRAKELANCYTLNSSSRSAFFFFPRDPQLLLLLLLSFFLLRAPRHATKLYLRDCVMVDKSLKLT
jgi:hypothetical protein